MKISFKLLFYQLYSCIIIILFFLYLYYPVNTMLLLFNTLVLWGFLLPNQGERSQLQDYRGRSRQPKIYEELFNHRHFSLRNIIECYFDVLNAYFPILKSWCNLTNQVGNH